MAMNALTSAKLCNAPWALNRRVGPVKAPQRIAWYRMHALTAHSSSGDSREVERASKRSRKPSYEEENTQSRKGILSSLAAGVLAAGVVGLSAVAPQAAFAEERQQVAMAPQGNAQMSYSRFFDILEQKRVRKVDLYENGTVAIAEIRSTDPSQQPQMARIQLPGPAPPDLMKKLVDSGVDIAGHNSAEEAAGGGNVFLSLLSSLGFPIILIVGLFLLSRRNQGNGVGGPGGSQNPLQFGKSKARVQMEPKTGVTFGDVAGVDEAKQDFQEVVEFLKSPEQFTAVGARIPKGVLLVGPPGTGKTLLAKAIAGEAGVPFFSISGSEFVEMFVGVGAARVRDLFKAAKKAAPCIIFVDEIDAVGRVRGTGIGGGNDEREQTLNQLLTEMDGFETNQGVIVVAATNRDDILDPALLRPGRFDRQVSVNVPDVKGREEILQVHGKTKRLGGDIDLDAIARRTPGFSGADLANLLNEAAILAGRRGRTDVSSAEIDDSIDRIVAGLEGPKMIDGKSKTLVAYHEVGHAICGTLTAGHDPVQKVTLVPRGQARGLTWFIPEEDPTLISKQQIFARVVGALGGRAAEAEVFGEPEVTTGAGSDLMQVSRLAKMMVTTYGFSNIGPWSLQEQGGQDMVMRMMQRNSMSPKLAKAIDEGVQKIASEAYEAARDHIKNNRDALDAIVDELLEVETMSGERFRELLSQFATIPKENFPSETPTVA